MEEKGKQANTKGGNGYKKKGINRIQGLDTLIISF
jgi:hypothetical protein